MLLQHFPRAGDWAEMDFYWRHFYAPVLPWVGWARSPLQVPPDSELQSALVKQGTQMSQVSLLKSVPTEVLEKNSEQVCISELDSKGKFALFSGRCCTLCSVRDAQQKRLQLRTAPYLTLLVQNEFCHSA